ncbi:HK97-gp10 family putative phage morphogenesis protein [Limosilactobacillus reuteri]|nr:HK97-gp10 family putative phage morphogenesis protein [Limosilactobacillus reuteri]MCC4342528.1 HK97 gp10 family phage protein [Limosilactobacillus reuteri]
MSKFTNSKIVGMDKLQAGLKERASKELIQQVVKKNGAKLHTQTQANMAAKYTGHYEWVKGKGRVFIKPTGNTRRSTKLTFTGDGLTATVMPHTKYFAYLEFGTRFMEARPTLKPAFTFQSMQFVKDLKKLVK